MHMRPTRYIRHACVQIDEAAAPTERVPVVLSGAACMGTEAALAQCPGVALDADNNNCGHADDVWISCSNGPQPGACILLCRVAAASLLYCAFSVHCFTHFGG